ncbi:YwgA family protein [Pseudalkalibacillus berkeleyi]|uniref:YwgA family protein n=1 Tax=Pseudalkalibacillus berkeleyi TaxID=1069813 RepID=A0ABS9H4R9_9BACL|nr:YwgA family protein [Pseudalkalibacillus berkeleyi]MCF6138960.1 YwgA family protein [Pseudalkalibacillus berkeleyi]
MLEHHARLIALFNYAREVVGRKKLQKIVYIAKKLEFPFGEKYQFHFYGPYSEELTLRVEELCNLGFIEETKEKVSGYYQYRYVLTEQGEQFLKHFDLDLGPLQSCVTSMNEQPSRILELISTILYFDHMTNEEIVEKVQTVKQKQKYTDEEIQEAFRYIDDLKKQTIMN